MPRRARQAVGGLIYHVMNRGCGRMRLFGRPNDYQAFLKVLEEAHRITPGVRILDFCLMPNHWHLVLWPTKDGELSRFMFWLTMTHVQRWRHARKLVGLGPLYQGRFRAFAIEEDDHLFAVLRYVERNPLRAKLVETAEDWKWGALNLRTCNANQARELLSDWPIDRPDDWLDWVNKAQSGREIEEIREHSRRGIPYGDPDWKSRAARLLGINLQPLPRGRPKLKARK